MYNGYNVFKTLASYSSPQSSSAFLRGLYNLPKPNSYNKAFGMDINKIQAPQKYESMQTSLSAFRSAYQKMLLRSAAEQLKNLYGRSNGLRQQI